MVGPLVLLRTMYVSKVRIPRYLGRYLGELGSGASVG